jgi:hypothetical protein
MNEVIKMNLRTYEDEFSIVLEDEYRREIEVWRFSPFETKVLFIELKNTQRWEENYIYCDYDGVFYINKERVSNLYPLWADEFTSRYMMIESEEIRKVEKI